MKVNDIKPALGVDRIKGTQAPSPEVGAAKDRVTVGGEAREIEAAVAAAKQAAGGNARAARLERLEAQVRAGGYRPDPSRMAEQILADAEIDARLQAMIRR